MYQLPSTRLASPAWAKTLVGAVPITVALRKAVTSRIRVMLRFGTNVARESADVILIGSDLSKLVETLKVARRCRGIIMQNFVGTLAVDSVGVGMAALGFLNPLLAAFIHVTSELAFILNSTRLLSRSSGSAQ
jgi:cation transport ATPase